MSEPTITNPINLNDNKKKVLYIVIAVILVIAIAAGIAFAIKTNVSNDDTNTSKQVLQQQADDLKSQAVKAQKENDETKAIELLQQAKDKYEATGDTNNKIDSEALIYTMQHN